MLVLIFWMVFGPLLVIAVCAVWLWLLSLLVRAVLGQ